MKYISLTISTLVAIFCLCSCSKKDPEACINIETTKAFAPAEIPVSFCGEADHVLWQIEGNGTFIDPNSKDIIYRTKINDKGAEVRDAIIYFEEKGVCELTQFALNDENDEKVNTVTNIEICQVKINKVILKKVPEFSFQEPFNLSISVSSKFYPNKTSGETGQLEFISGREIEGNTINISALASFRKGDEYFNERKYYQYKVENFESSSPILLDGICEVHFEVACE